MAGRGEGGWVVVESARTDLEADRLFLRLGLVGKGLKVLGWNAGGGMESLFL